MYKVILFSLVFISTSDASTSTVTKELQDRSVGVSQKLIFDSLLEVVQDASAFEVIAMQEGLTNLERQASLIEILDRFEIRLKTAKANWSFSNLAYGTAQNELNQVRSWVLASQGNPNSEALVQAKNKAVELRSKAVRFGNQVLEN